MRIKANKERIALAAILILIFIWLCYLRISVPVFKCQKNSIILEEYKSNEKHYGIKVTKPYCLRAAPINVFIHEKLPKRFRPAVQSAISEWNKSVGFELLRFTGYGSGPDGFENIKDENVILVTWKPLKNFQNGPSRMELGSYEAWNIDGQVRMKGLVEMNSNCKYITGNEPMKVTRYDFDSLVLHGIGHALGINGHIDDDKSSNAEELVMYRALHLGETRRVLKKRDVDMLQCAVR